MKRFKENIIHNRITNLVLVFLILFSSLIGRLYWFQINKHEELKFQVLKQRGKEIKLAPNRGIIYDRNLTPLTNRNKILMGFVYKNTIERDENLKAFILKNSEFNHRELEEFLKDKENIVAIPLKSNILNMENNKDIYFANKTNRYDSNNILSHVIGYINKSENKGEAGIEKIYDEILGMGDNGTLYLETDDNRNIIFGGEYAVGKEITPNSPNGVQLTIDYNIQRIVEDILDKEKINGAVIVAHTDGDILAMASRPNFNPEDIDEYFNRDDMTLYNKAIQVAYPPGSLFKIVVLLAALEENIDFQNRLFYCKGYEKINDTTIKCNNIYGHGYLELNEAFSKSCNSAFIQIGRELGGKKIIDMAKKLGFGEKINIGLLEEVPGNLPSGTEIQGPNIGNISIGQGQIETTPLQISNMMMIIANNGIKKDISIIEGITNSNGNIIKKYNREEDQKILSEEISKILKNYLISVINRGTAQNIDLSEIGGGGGKTGSAQAVLNRKMTIHGWFSGFFPEEKPEYVITVFTEQGISGAETAAPIFEKISKEIYKINR